MARVLFSAQAQQMPKNIHEIPNPQDNVLGGLFSQDDHWAHSQIDEEVNQLTI